MATKTVRLTFRGPVHFGQGRLSDSTYACDAATLFSALFIEALQEGVQDELLEAARCGELMLSDAFPYIGNTLYLPKPMVAPVKLDDHERERAVSEGGQDSRQRKANKKLAYIPAKRYVDYLAGDFDSLEELERFELGEASLQTKVNLARSDSDDAKPYFVGGYTYALGAGLYFLVKGGYDIEPLLEPMRYAGLGGKRTSGYGRFEYQVDCTDPLAQFSMHGTKTESFVLLATSAPRSDELDDELLEGARYRLVRRGGFIQSVSHSKTPQKKHDMYLFAAGAIFSHQFEGDVFDVNATQGSHPVYRYAKAFWMEV